MPIRTQFDSDEEWLSHLRLWFAGQALVGLLSGYYRQTTAYNLGEVPTEALKIADAMIAAHRTPAPATEENEG